MKPTIRITNMRLNWAFPTRLDIWTNGNIQKKKKKKKEKEEEEERKKERKEKKKPKSSADAQMNIIQYPKREDSNETHH
jgi:hypothetical protein